jgi:DNA-binding NarL/FixJ family response regulator
MNPKHFFVVEDQTLVRRLLVAHLRGRYAECRIDEAGSVAELAGAEATQTADLTILDLELSDGSALDWVEGWAARQAAPRVVILTARDEDYVLFRALRSNLPGFVHKEDEPQILHLAIDTVLAGGTFFSPTVQRLRSRLQTAPDFFHRILSEREQKILELIGGGLDDSEAAGLLGLRGSSVADHRKNIMGKLGLHSRPELMRYAIEKGFSRI